MAKRQRDHRAEYLRRKEIANKSGFGSVRKYKRVRKELALPRTTRVSTTGIRKQSVFWSAGHSRTPNSRYSPDFTDEQALSYYQAYVIKSSDENAKKRRLHKYLVGNGLVTEDEWKANYLGQV